MENENQPKKEEWRFKKRYAILIFFIYLGVSEGPDRTLVVSDSQPTVAAISPLKDKQ